MKIRNGRIQGTAGCRRKRELYQARKNASDKISSGVSERVRLNSFVAPALHVDIEALDFLIEGR